MHTKTPVVLACLASAAWTPAGSTAAAVTAAERAALDKAIETWNQLGASEYSFYFQILCNCLPAETARMHLEVAENAIHKAVYADNVYETRIIDEVEHILIHRKGSEVPPEISDNLKTVGAELQQIKELISTPLAEYEAELDGRTGVPCRVYVDLSEPLFDNEVEYVLSNFEFAGKDSVAMGCAAEESEFVHMSKPVIPDSDQVE